jgi:hypothetical protein
VKRSATTLGLWHGYRRGREAVRRALVGSGAGGRRGNSVMWLAEEAGAMTVVEEQRPSGTWEVGMELQRQLGLR